MNTDTASRFHIHFDCADMWDRAHPVLRGSSSLQQWNLLPSRCHARGFERGTRSVSVCRCWDQLCPSKSLQLDMLVRSGWVLITETNTQYEVWGVHKPEAYTTRESDTSGVSGWNGVRCSNTSFLRFDNYFNGRRLKMNLDRIDSNFLSKGFLTYNQ